MKKNSTKRSFDKFTKRSKAKRRQKDRAIKELKKAVASVNSQYGDVKFSDALNLGRRKRSGCSAHGHYREEIVSEGSFTSSKSGFGFVSVPDFEKDIFIPEGKCAEAIDGDTVEISYHTYTSGGEVRTEGVVKRIKKVGRKTLVGTVVRMPVSRRDRYLANKFSLMPDEPRVLVRPFITEIASATEGDKVEAVIDRDASGRVIGARVIRVFGEASSREANYEAILEGSGITVEFSKEELEEAQRVSSEKISYEGRALFDNDVIFNIKMQVFLIELPDNMTGCVNLDRVANNMGCIESIDFHNGKCEGKLICGEGIDGTCNYIFIAKGQRGIYDVRVIVDKYLESMYEDIIDHIIYSFNINDNIV